MKDDYLDDGENKSAASGTLSYMSQQFVPYAKLNTNQGQDPDQGQDQDGGADADADQHSGTDADSDDDSELDLYINKFANRELDPSSAAAASDSPAAANKDDEGDEGEQEPVDQENKLRMEIYDWLQCIVSAIICGIFIFVFIGRTIGVDGNSMMQTLHNNDRVIMSNFFYTPKQGDIIVFQTSTDSFGGTPLVKRVIAVAGQTIAIDFQTGDVFVDGKLQDEPYINELTHTRIHFSGEETVPEGCVFVMGDNRNHSSDSRDSRVGMVDTRYILGRVLVVAIPGADEQNPRDWSRLGATH